MPVTVRTVTETFVHVNADRFDIEDHSGITVLHVFLPGHGEPIAIYKEWLSVSGEEIAREVAVGKQP